ncbi:MAG TPA: cofactor-independent phosphoglycerate mutase [Candidatus Subteraquimicrobiales bacterium]
MKYVILVPDGAADRPVKELNGKTPLQVAKIPNMNFIAREGIVGTVKTVPRGTIPGSDVANLTILGYNPLKYFTGRGPLEAASRGISLNPDEFAFRCNLISVEQGILKDYSAGHISSEEGRSIIEALNQKFGTSNVRFLAGVSYRHLMIIKGDFSKILCVPPHNVVNQPIRDNLPQGEDAGLIRDFVVSSQEFLENHPVNLRRKERGKNPANMIWLWGQGKAPTFPTVKEKYGLDGAIISAVDLIKGIGYFAGLEPLEVPGATGYFDTNYEQKAEYALRALEKKDLVFVHVEASDEAGHQGSTKDKIRALENFDRLVKIILEGLKKYPNYRVLLVPDHATPLELRIHTDEPVPFALYSSNDSGDGAESFNELSALKGSHHFEEGYELMTFFVGGGRKEFSHK